MAETNVKNDPSVCLTDHFLIAMPALEDPNFSQTVTYVCEHRDEGAMGIVINRPTEVTLGELFDHMGLETHELRAREELVLMGGPVKRDRGFVLHSPDPRWKASMEISERVALSTSREMLAAIAAGDGPQKAIVALGYAGWGAGQLEEEMAQNAWLSGPADPEVIFDTAHDDRWRAAAANLGIDISLLSSGFGNA